MIRLHIMSWTTRLLMALVVLIVAARLVAPYVVKSVVNDKLAHLEGYRGHVDDIDLHIWRGAYEAQGLKIEKLSGKVPVPFVSLECADLGVQWPALIHGAIVAKIALFRPEVNFVKGPTPATTQTGKGEDWQKQLEQLVPLKIDHFVVVDGEIHFRDTAAKPKVNVYIDHLNVNVSNLTNSDKLSKNRVADLHARANVMHSGRLRVDGDINPFTKQPTFELKTRLDALQIRQLNDFLKAYVDVDAEKGKFSLYSEVRSNNGSFKGYVKPIIEDLDILDWKHETERPIEKIWEGLVGAAAAIVTNQGKDRLASKIPLEGQFKQPDIKAWQAVGSLLRNAFIQALRHGLETHAT